MRLFIIGGIQKTTLVDFPSKIASIVFTQGCNFRCGYCHNPEIHDFKHESKYKTEEFIEFLKTRKGKLDGVVITGGEPTLQSGLYDFIKQIKYLGFAVKLDTNGSNFNIIKKLINDNLLDYVAMDIKASFDKYDKIIGVHCNIENIKKSISLIINSNVDYEFRTTIINEFHTLQDIFEIIELIGNSKYYLQNFKNSEYVLDKNLTSFAEEKLVLWNEILKDYPNVYIRGIKK